MNAAILLAAGLAGFAGSQPQLATGGGAVYLTFAAGDTISVVRSADADATFGVPVTLPGAGRLSLGKHRGPRIAVTAEAVLVAAIAGAKGGGADGNLVLYRSTDQGRTWSAARTINDVPGAAREGMHGLAANASGLVVVAWLDLRQAGTRIRAAISRDHAATWSSDTLVYASPSGSVCECCHPSVAVAADGRVAILFRNQVDGRRDMYVVESRDGKTFGAAVKQGRGSWTLEACPMDGGALALGAEATYAVWRRESTVFSSTTAGATVSSPAEVSLAAGHDPVVAVDGRRVDMAWSAADGLVLQQAGKPAAAIGPGRFASILALPTQTLLAFEDRGRVSVRSVPR